LIAEAQVSCRSLAQDHGIWEHAGKFFRFRIGALPVDQRHFPEKIARLDHPERFLSAGPSLFGNPD
jgi:hypothetical protein